MATKSLFEKVSGMNLSAAELEQLNNDTHALISAGVIRSHFHSTKNAARREKCLNEFYNIFNETYFGGRLPEFKVCLTNLDAHHAFGSAFVKGYVIWLDEGNTYKRNDAAVLNTLLHECIHVYQWYVIKNFSRWHGKEFNAWRKALNEFGWRLGTKSPVNPFAHN